MAISSNKKIKVGLVQIGDKFGEDYYLPYSLGLLQACAQKNLKNPKGFEFLSPLYKRTKVAAAVGYLLQAEIVFFSTYVWNYRINLAIAKDIKKEKKNCVIAFGGPQVPESSKEMESFLRENPFIDIASYGEGETSFLGILENFKSKSWGKVPGVGFRDSNGEFVYTENKGEPGQLKPFSPYLDKIFDSLMKANPKESWSGLIETNRGCPFTCAYCYWGRRANKRVIPYDLKRVFKEIDWFSKKKIEFVFCCDANFGLFPRDLEIAKKVAENKRKYGYPKAFSVQNTKNSTERIFQLQKILNDAGLQRGVNLALQSLNPPTLKNINRNNISNQTYRDLQIMFTKSKIPTFSDLIIGLPGESYDSFANGVASVIREGQHNRLQFINLMILDNTVMANPDYKKKFGLIVKESRVISHHGSLDNNPEIFETQNLVVGTKSMDKNDWIKTRVFCWTISLFYFNKLLQIPFILLNKLYGVSYRDLAEIFSAKTNKYKQISKIYSDFVKKAKEIQNGGFEYVPSKEWLGIWWPIDEHLFIKIFFDGESGEFYKEAESAIYSFLKRKKIKMPPGLLREAIEFNRSLVKIPFVKNDLDILLHYNIFEVYQGLLSGVNVPLKKGEFKYKINRTKDRWRSWLEWFREVVWHGTKRGAYLYNCRATGEAK
jgi:tRNA A37 methylthiotransferase MiaB